MANIKDVARLAGVSVSSVSRVINNSATVVEEKRQAILAAMDELNYQPNVLARALVNSRSDCIGLMVGEIESPFFGQLMASVYQVAMAQGKHVLFTAGYHQLEQERSAIQFLQERRCDALLIHSKALPDDFIISLFQLETPVVLLNRCIVGWEHKCVYLDNEYGAFLATQHLIENGHTNIAYLGTETAIEDGLAREAGYRRALEAAGIEFSAEKIAYGAPDEEGGMTAALDLLSRGAPYSAVFVYNDAMAAGAMAALQDHDLAVPNDVSVVGFDDVILARVLKPHLTTIRYPITEMGRLATDIVLRDLENNEQPIEQDRKFTPMLVSRQSVLAK